MVNEGLSKKKSRKKKKKEDVYNEGSLFEERER